MGKGHARNEDVYLNKGGENELSAVEIKVAVDNAHAPHSDDQVVIGNYDGSIVDGSDDCFVFVQDSAIDLSGIILAGNNDGGSDNSGFRWQNIDIPKGAIITSAYITLTAAGDTLGVITNITINGEASDNPNTFSTFEDFIARPFCSSSVPYIAPPFLDAEVYNTPELKTIIQEIIDRSGWISGNSIVLFLNDNGSDSFCVRNICNVESISTSSAKLHIEYTYGVEIAINKLDTEKPTISQGTVAPTSTPIKVGDVYIDIVAKNLYFAIGITSSADWIIAN
jgi:hypothetical protein